jgi:L-fucose isomerase-like protein
MSNKIKLKFIAFTNAELPVFDQIKSKLDTIHGLNYEATEEDFDALFFVSGGSEQFAISSLVKGSINLLIAGKENNAWAAATEVKAWANQNGFEAVMIPANDLSNSKNLEQYIHIKRSFDRLKGQRLGLIGEVSDWLVASSVSQSDMMEKFGIELINLPYDQLQDYLDFPADEQMGVLFPSLSAQQSELASISSFLKDTVKQKRLDAMTIQCFRMVREKEVTACLPVALMNYNGTPAGCEGDLASIISIMFLKETLGQIAWMANVASVDESSILLAHCTAPLQLAGSVEIKTHYETDLSAAICADLDMEEVTIFRMNSELSKAFIAEGVVLAKPAHQWACRTQLEVGLKEEDLVKLRHNPLGNHHLVVKGHQSSFLKTAMQLKGIVCI